MTSFNVKRILKFSHPQILKFIAKIRFCRGFRSLNMAKCYLNRVGWPGNNSYLCTPN